ncbi:hypothetical protein BT67DRAFT_431070 [Trichocladium antarcticum]|uniref:Uncharacterized protein n=1 Tax=Trichocladium antarcticum TaxID=1450529 RepID=A0AAN6USX6_9PEZI|nr:hypothetical protein BT67DRAFT_431070 [Trichocladium antarcticum]
MCGEETTPSNTPRIGARVDFFSTSGHNTHLGNLLFLNPSTPSSTHATHVRFQHHPSTPRQQQHPLTPSARFLVSIHKTGDLTKPLADSGLMQQFTLYDISHAHDANANDNSSSGFEMVLSETLSLNVGDDGIIGRRVSMRRGGELVGDGIVGFNFPPPAVVSV